MSTNVEQAPEGVGQAAGSVKQTAQEGVGHAAGKGRGALRRQVDERSTMAGHQASSVAETMRRAASQMREEGDPQKARMASFADQGADRLERVGGYLTDADADELLGRVEDMARQQPWLIAGAGLLVGIAAARVLEASSTDRYYRTRPVRPVSSAEALRPQFSPVAP
jgi:ElaB/YqjD/DUF883 family membrane-anchored ribosome-binding protein